MTLISRARPGFLAASLMISGLATPSAAADWLAITDFTGACGATLTCAGATEAHGTALRLVPAAANQAGAAWAAAPLSVDESFVSIFTFRLSEGATDWRADGLAFILARDPAGLGDATRFGGSLGLEGLDGTVAVEFDTFDNGEAAGDNHVALAIGGDMDNLAASHPYGAAGCDTAGQAGCLSNGGLWTGIVAYDADAHTISVTVQDGNAAPSLVIDAYAINLAATLGGTTAYPGFGAGTGAGYMAHDLLGWSVTTADETRVPEPATALLLGGAVAALGLRRRRRV